MRAGLWITVAAVLFFSGFGALGENKPADMSKPIKVYILMGQSNMLGFGNKAKFIEIAKANKEHLDLIDAAGNFVERKDVRNVHVMNSNTIYNNWLNVNARKHIGPDLNFGTVMGEHHEAGVLVLKSAIGNRSLGWDLLPPGSKQYEVDGKIYAGYKDSPESWTKGTKPKAINWYAGKQYDTDVKSAKEALANIKTFYPEYKGQGYEIAGFVFFQGHKDQGNAVHAKRYEFNMVNFIKALRKDFDVPEAKFAIATIAFGGTNMKGNTLIVAEAQLAVDGKTGKYPEFKGNVATVDTRAFNTSATSNAHYGGDSVFYCKVGEALGKAMAGMVGE